MSVKNVKWSSHYQHSDISRIRNIEACLARLDKPRRALITEFGLRRQTTYDVLNGNYHAPPTKHIAEIERVLGIEPTKPEITVDLDLWTPAEPPLAELRTQIMKLLAPHSKARPLARRDLIEAVQGKRSDVVDALDALISERLVCDVIITRQADPAVVYCYPAGRMSDKYTFRVAAPTAKTGRRK